MGEVKTTQIRSCRSSPRERRIPHVTVVTGQALRLIRTIVSTNGRSAKSLLLLRFARSTEGLLRYWL